MNLQQVEFDLKATNASDEYNERLKKQNKYTLFVCFYHQCFHFTWSITTRNTNRNQIKSENTNFNLASRSTSSYLQRAIILRKNITVDPYLFDKISMSKQKQQIVIVITCEFRFYLADANRTVRCDTCPTTNRNTLTKSINPKFESNQYLKFSFTCNTLARATHAIGSISSIVAETSICFRLSLLLFFRKSKQGNAFSYSFHYMQSVVAI